MVEKKRRSTVYAPPPPARRTQPHRPTARPQRDRFIYIRNSLPVIITCGLLFVLLVVGSIIYNISRPQVNTTTIVMPNGTTNNQQPVTPPASLQHAADPHELVITPQDTDHPPPPVNATSAYLLDADTGATLYAHNPFMHLPMLSTTKLMTAVLAVIGFVSYKNTPIETFPDVTNAQIIIIAQWPGRSAEEVEKFVSIPLETALNSVQKKTSLRTTSSFGLSYIRIIFDDDVDDVFAR